MSKALSRRQLMAEAWTLTKGIKGKIWLATLWMILAVMVLQAIWYLVFKDRPDMLYSRTGALLSDALESIVEAPFFGGIVMMAVLRAREQSITYRSWIPYARYHIKVAITLFIMTFLMGLPMIIDPTIAEAGQSNMISTFILPSVWALVFGYLFLTAINFLVDKNTNPISALMLSIELSLKKIAIILPLYIAINVIVLLSVILVGIPFIWTYPFLLLLIARLYVALT